MKSVAPPVAALTNENMKLFLVKCWETGSKPNVQQGRKWLTHALTTQGMPPLNKLYRQHYAETLDMLKGLSKEQAWRDHVTKSTDAFELDTTSESYSRLHVQENLPRVCGQRPRRAVPGGSSQQGSRGLHDHQPWVGFQ